MKLFPISTAIATVMLFFAAISSGQNSVLPEPIALYPLNEQHGTKDISQQKNPSGKATGVELAPGYYGQPAGSFYFSGSSSSFIEFPNNGGLDARYSLTLAAWIWPENCEGPLFSYRMNDKDGVRVWLENPNIRALFEIRDSVLPFGIKSDKVRLNAWNYVASSFDHSTGAMKLWIDGREVASLNVGRNEIATQGNVWIGAVTGGSHFYKGRIACVQIYNKSLSEQEINAVKDRCPVKAQSRHIGCYAGKAASAIPSLEGKDPLLDGDPKTRQDAEQKCARVALKRGFVYFAIQDGGHCHSSLTAQDSYNKYGLSTDCQRGKGGKMASDVYEVIMFRDQTCWNGWDSKEDSCYKLYNDKKTWAGAQAECKAQRGDLAKLNSQDKNYFVFLQLIKPANPSSSVWIGLSRDSDEKFHWSDDALAEYTNWAPGSPDTSPGNKKNCTRINVFSGLWENEEFDFTHPFVCGRVIPATPREVRVKLMNSHSALVTWSTPEKHQQLVTSYYVEYKLKNSQEVRLKVVQNQNETSLTGLQSHAVYEVRVRAVNGAGGGIWSHYETFSTGQTYSPRIDPLSPVRALIPGETLVLNCTARGGPEPTITWYKNRKLIYRGQALVIRNDTSSLHGLYTCRAGNGIQPDDIASVTVTSMAPPIVKHAWGTAENGELFVKKGERLSLRCETENMTIADITWYKDSEPLPVQQYSSRNMISFQEISGDDLGVYECTARNSLGVASKKMKVVNAEQLTHLKAAIGCVAALLIICLISIAVLVWLLLKAKKTAASNVEEEQGEDPLPTLAGPRPSDHDFKIPEVLSTGSPQITSPGNKSSYAPLSAVDSPNGGTGITFEATSL